ncbi:MAG: nicotinamide-nucleotide adenylyltransferase [Promethearchaeota archaeon]
MQQEILACIDKINNKYLQSGQISKYTFPMERNKAHNKKVGHLITRFFILSITPEGEILYLVQKRSKTKKTFPEYYTDSSSGHVIWEKNLDLNKIKNNALRELEEEFGITPKMVKKTLFHEINVEGDEIAYIFFGIVDHDVPIKPNSKELDVYSSKFYNKTELKHLLESEKNVDYSKQIWNKLLSLDIVSLFKKNNESLNKDKNKIALFIGRFQPLHHGHLYVLRTILKSFSKVKIGIGSSQLNNTINDPFKSEERRKFLNAVLEKRKISSKRYEIFEIPDIFNAKKWVDHVISIVGKVHSIFSNSDWVRELFLKKGFKVEKKISIFKKKFNANNIRNLIIKNDKTWKTLVPKEIIQLIEDFDGLNRIKSLHEKEDNI